MSESSSNPFWRFLVGVGKVINFVNTFVFNVIMGLFVLFLLALLLVAMAAKSGNGGAAIKPVLDKTALVIDLQGTLVEQYTSAPIARAIAQASGGRDAGREIQLRDLLQALDIARTDPKIHSVVIKTDGFQVAGFAAMRELGAALRDFRASGKPVIAYGAGMEQKGYYLAAQADQVYLDPDGAVLLEGLGRYRLYYRQGLQDKLGVDVHLFRVGEFKSAAEPYILDAASPESREADLFWMNDLWQRYLVDVAAARKLPVADLTALVNELPARIQAQRGDLAQLALDAKLVDGLKTQQEFEKLVAERGAWDEEAHSFRQVGLYHYLLQRKAGRGGLLDRRGEVAVVVAQGEITDGEQPPGTVGGESTAALVRQAREDDQVKALVLRVDSPGGGVMPSELIRREVALTRAAGKPVVVSMGNVAASGGYWIAMDADRILADPSTITGSIGIFGLWLSAPRALDKIGVHSDGVGTTPLAGAFDLSRPLDPGVGVVIQSVIEHGYAQFIGKVAKARNSDPAKVDAIARGRVWSGAQAKERGLVDELGGLREAQAEAARLAKLGKDYDVQYVEKPLSAIEQLFLDMSRSARLSGLVRNVGIAPALLGEDAVARVHDELAWLRGPKGASPVRAVAHCLCGF
jgi:protease-4